MLAIDRHSKLFLDSFLNVTIRTNVELCKDLGLSRNQVLRVISVLRRKRLITVYVKKNRFLDNWTNIRIIMKTGKT